jgi:hypothetical protein
MDDGFCALARVGFCLAMSPFAFSHLSVSFFDWAKNETQKTHPSTALRLALRLRHGTSRNSRAKLAQTATRSVRGSSFALETTNRARPGVTARDPASRPTPDGHTFTPSHSSWPLETFAGPTGAEASRPTAGRFVEWQKRLTGKCSPRRPRSNTISSQQRGR